MPVTLDDFTIESSASTSFGKWKRLLPLEKSSPSYSRVEKLFNKGWKHNQKAKPHVFAVYKIISPEGTLKPYLDYLATVQASPSIKAAGKTEIESLLFHGTKRSCLLGENSKHSRLCGSSKCSVCSIIRGSFDIEKCGSKHKFMRFGEGIYSTSCSSKADDYSSNGSAEAGLKVLIVSRVVVGKSLKRKMNATNLTELPCGYHSLVGEPGEDLNYSETVVYDNDAIRPAYLMVYGAKPEESKLKNMISTLFKTPVAL
ncbi:ADP-ribosylation [Athelia psychrophila]|uniref:ADP-ribosylation n=1 Tax=Athelia psychrophila TaxID=1759441 RepID=A0A167UUS3_9AGAM|nr:ADP-ribosylation [Fibularhizoctonia sp. CBS 109695]